LADDRACELSEGSFAPSGWKAHRCGPDKMIVFAGRILNDESCQVLGNFVRPWILTRVPSVMTYLMPFFADREFGLARIVARTLSEQIRNLLSDPVKIGFFSEVELKIPH